MIGMGVKRAVTGWIGLALSTVILTGGLMLLFRLIAGADIASMLGEIARSIGETMLRG